MDGPIKLHAERDLLERRLLLLERVLQEQQRQGVAAPELVKREADLLAQLAPVNDQLAAMHGSDPISSR